jgi:hypothetical protein
MGRVIYPPSGPQLVEIRPAKVGKDHHMMPGLVAPLVSAFHAPRKCLTTRGVAREQGVAETFVHTALFRDVYREIAELRALVGGDRIRRVA